MVENDSLLLDEMQVFVKYAREFEQEYAVGFVEARVKDIVNDSILSEYLPSRVCTIFDSPSCVWKMDKLLSPVQVLSIDVSSWKNLGIFHVNSSVLYSLESDEVELMIELPTTSSIT